VAAAREAAPALAAPPAQAGRAVSAVQAEPGPAEPAESGTPARTAGMPAARREAAIARDQPAAVLAAAAKAGRRAVAALRVPGVAATQARAAAAVALPPAGPPPARGAAAVAAAKGVAEAPGLVAAAAGPDRAAFPEVAVTQQAPDRAERPIRAAPVATRAAAVPRPVTTRQRVDADALWAEQDRRNAATGIPLRLRWGSYSWPSLASVEGAPDSAGE